MRVQGLLVVMVMFVVVCSGCIGVVPGGVYYRPPTVAVGAPVNVEAPAQELAPAEGQEQVPLPTGAYAEDVVIYDVAPPVEFVGVDPFILESSVYFWGGDYYHWYGGRYVVVDDFALRGRYEGFHHEQKLGHRSNYHRPHEGRQGHHPGQKVDKSRQVNKTPQHPSRQQAAPQRQQQQQKKQVSPQRQQQRQQVAPRQQQQQRQQAAPQRQQAPAPAKKKDQK